jgi:hypothetical protein
VPGTVVLGQTHCLSCTATTQLAAGAGKLAVYKLTHQPCARLVSYFSDRNSNSKQSEATTRRTSATSPQRPEAAGASTVSNEGQSLARVVCTVATASSSPGCVCAATHMGRPHSELRKLAILQTSTTSNQGTSSACRAALDATHFCAAASTLHKYSSSTKQPTANKSRCKAQLLTE